MERRGFRNSSEARSDSASSLAAKSGFLNFLAASGTVIDLTLAVYSTCLCLCESMIHIVRDTSVNKSVLLYFQCYEYQRQI